METDEDMDQQLVTGRQELVITRRTQVNSGTEDSMVPQRVIDSLSATLEKKITTEVARITEEKVKELLLAQNQEFQATIDSKIDMKISSAIQQHETRLEARFDQNDAVLQQILGRFDTMCSPSSDSSTGNSKRATRKKYPHSRQGRGINRDRFQREDEERR